MKNIKELKINLKEAVKRFNENKKQVVNNLYNSMSGRLISVIQKRGDRLKY